MQLCLDQSNHTLHFTHDAGSLFRLSQLDFSVLGFLIFQGSTLADSTVRVLSMSGFCRDFPENLIRCLSDVRMLSIYSIRCLTIRISSVSILSVVRITPGISYKILSDVGLSGQTRAGNSCPGFRCPPGLSAEVRSRVLLQFQRKF